MTRTLRTLVAATLLAVVASSMAAQASDAPTCTDGSAGVAPLTLASGATGQYSVPAESPTVLAVYAHGYGHDSDSWVTHMTLTADRGAAAVAMDYRGTYVDGAGNVRGWFVNEGAQDSVDAAQLFLTTCSSIETVIIYGVSMGGNTSGLAVALKATRSPGVPLFDYWVAGEPAANATETYLEATAVQAAVPFAALARADIEDEYNGTPAENPTGYLNGTVVARIADIAAAGLKGVSIVHGFDDGLVPYNQARELATELRAVGIPTDFYNATFRESGGSPCGNDNTTLTENALKPLVAGLQPGECYEEPLAGHSTESSQTSLVVQTGLDVVFDLIDGQALPANGEFIVDGGRRP